MSSIHKIDIAVLNVENNVYWQNNQIMFNRLLNIINTSNTYVRRIKCIGAQDPSRDNSDLLAWIMDQTGCLGDQYEIKTRCYWILHGLTEFPKCWNYEECGRNLEHKNIKDIWTGYGTGCCSKECNGKLRVLNTRKNLFSRYGVVNVFQLQHVKDKCEATHIKNLGVKNPSQSEVVKKQKIETCLKNYGVEHPLQSEEIQKRFTQTCLEKFGCNYPGQSKIVKQHIIETNQQRRGVDYVFQDKSVQQTIQEKILSVYGVDCILKSPEIIEKTHNFYRKTYGVESGMQVPEIRKKAQRRYIYDGRYFDSAPELAYYVWLKDNGVDFEYQPGIGFDYEFAGKKRKYFPDFRVGNEYVEIKGDQFLTSDGTWRNPYRDPEWSDERYADECARYEAKRQCALSNGVRIMYSSDYSAYVSYVNEKYGNGYLRGFRMRKI